MLRKRFSYINLGAIQPKLYLMSQLDQYAKELSFQTDRRRATVALIKIISDLWYDQSI